MKVRKFRILRLRHHVSMVELGRACGLSAQRISELELSEGCAGTGNHSENFKSGFERILIRAYGRCGASASGISKMPERSDAARRRR